jgi:hypothetical protein
MAVFNPDVSTFKIANIGEAVQSGQQIQYNRLKNEAIGMDVQEAKDMLANRKKAAEIRARYDGLPAQIEALDKAQMFDQADELRNQYISARKMEVDVIEAMRPGIDKDNYAQIRQDFLQTGAIEPAMWPVEYSDKWFKEKAKDKRGALTKLTRRWAADGSVLSQDIVQGDGEILWEGAAYQDPNDVPSEDEFEFSAIDSRELGEQSERLYGGTWDPISKSIVGLDREKAAKVAEVHALSSKIYDQGKGKIPHPVAFAQAARRLGVRIPDPDELSTSDPLGLRNALNPEPR